MVVAVVVTNIIGARNARIQLLEILFFNYTMIIIIKDLLIRQRERERDSEINVSE